MRRACLSFMSPSLLLLPLALSLLEAKAGAHQVEVGGFVGGHLYGENNELGRPDLDPRSPGNAPQHTGMLGLRLAYLPIPRIALEAEVAAVPGTTRDSSTTLVALHYRAHLLVNILTGRVRPFLLVGGGAASSVYSSNESLLSRDTDLYVHGGAGLQIDLTPRLTLRLDGRVLFPPRIDDNLFTQDYEVLLGLSGRFGGGARPEAPREPEEPLRPRQIPTRMVPVADSDRDKDGIVDRLDKCPDVAGLAIHDGCPPPDSDKDGVPDAEDKCPTQAGPKALDGCPDRDNDGIPDAQDKCPDKPETKNGFEDSDGCPDEIPKAMARFTGVIKGINFKTGKDVIVKSSFKLLDKAVAVLKEFPSIHLELSGHTDNVGDPAANKDLSQRRADAVKRYFTNKGIAADWLIARGYGDEKPIADNKSKAGKSKNRRVEFAILSQW